MPWTEITRAHYVREGATNVIVVDDEPVSREHFSRANNSFPSVMRGLKPNPFAPQRLRSTNFPFG